MSNIICKFCEGKGYFSCAGNPYNFYPICNDCKGLGKKMFLLDKLKIYLIRRMYAFLNFYIYISKKVSK